MQSYRFNYETNFQIKGLLATLKCTRGKLARFFKIKRLFLGHFIKIIK